MAVMSPAARRLLERLTCPRCWHECAPEDVKWIAQHQSLTGDPVAGEFEGRRFLPSRFNLAGNAIDESGKECTGLACPNCHGRLHSSLLELPALYLSIFGAPQSGKSFYLGAMLHRLESMASEAFRLAVENIAPEANMRPSGYTSLYERAANDEWITIPRTQPFEADYHRARINGEDHVYPAPYLYRLTAKRLGSDERRRTSSRLLCLYDVAGETFLPNFPAENRPLGNHLGLSKALLFVFDPTLQPGFRAACAPYSEDPQFDDGLVRPFEQAGIVATAAERVRQLLGLNATDVSDRSLVVIVNKFDAWGFLAGGDLDVLDRAVGRSPENVGALDLGVIEAASERVKGILRELSPRVVTAAESAFAKVTYLPVTCTNAAPQLVQDLDGEEKLMFRRGTLEPRWAEIPALYALHLAQEGEALPLIPAGRRAGRAAGHEGGEPGSAIHRAGV